MSNDALNWAWKAKVGPAKLVLVALADNGQSHSGEDWTCFPSVNKLIEMTDMGRSTIERHLRTLDAEGWLTRRRRVRKDGRLGIFDYTLHQDPEVRAQLKAERAATAGSASLLAESPPLNMSGGDADPPALKSSEASAQFDAEPALKSSALEPLADPLGIPQSGAREPGDDGFEGAWALWPTVGRTRSSPPAARGAWARACDAHDPEDLLRAIKRYVAEDPDVRRGVVRSFEGFLGREYYRHWLPGAGSARPHAPQLAAKSSYADLPPEVLDPLAKWLGGALAVSLLQGSTWDAERRVVLTRSSTAARRLNEEVPRARRQELKLEFEPALQGAAGGKS